MEAALGCFSQMFSVPLGPPCCGMGGLGLPRGAGAASLLLLLGTVPCLDLCVLVSRSAVHLCFSAACTTNVQFMEHRNTVREHALSARSKGAA